MAVIANRAIIVAQSNQPMTEFLVASWENILGACLCFRLMWTRKTAAHWFVVLFGLVVTFYSWSATTISSGAAR